MSVTDLNPRDRDDDSRVQELREDLAAAFRLAARFGWHESVANHFSAAVSEDGKQFLINPKWRHFSSLRASELLELDADDAATLGRDDAPDETAWGLHGAIHRAFPQARCVLHCHPRYGTVLAALADSNLPPIDQNAMRFYERIGIDAGYGGMALGSEAERACELLAETPVLVMGNHGVLVTGASVAAAFDELYYLERACETLVLAYQTQKPLRVAPHEVARRTCEQWQRGGDAFAASHFAELRRILDRESADYRD